MPMAVLQAYRSHMEDSVDYNAPSSPAQDEDMTSKADQEMQSVGQKRNRSEADDRGQAGSKRHAACTSLNLRLLCPQAISGSIIGKGGETISQIRQHTGARIKVEHNVAGCDERIVCISSAVEQDSKSSPAQEALYRILDCILDAEARDSDTSGQATARLLVATGQIGCILGKGGSIVSEMRQSTGARIKIVGAKDRPLVAAEGDELIHISGEVSRVKAALESITAQLRANPPRNQPQSISITANASYNGLPGALVNAIAPLNGFGGVDRAAAVQMQSLLGMQGRSQSPAQSAPVEVQFWMLVPAAQAGMIIGRGGDVIRRIRNDTEARVKVHEEAVGEDRVVQISAMEEDRNAGAAQEALLRCCTCLSPDPSTSCALRLIVPSPQIGSVLGKGGKTIAALRAETNVSVRVIPWSEARPNCFSEKDSSLETLQIEGRQPLALSALRAATALLRQWQVRNHQPANGESMYSSGTVSLPSQGLGIATEPLSALQGLLGQQNLSHLAALLGLNASLAGTQRAGSPLHLSPISTHGQGHAPGMSRAGREREQGGVARMLIEAGQVGMVLGQGGSNINQIRQISGARVKLRDDRLDGGKRELELFGSPEQIQAAKNIVQAFLLTGHSQMNGTHQGRHHR